ncbi:Protein CBG20931 [Caenorhabditis briggsae]|uniref:GST N-terminal domain-containing protein n=2 Tax=Caenorhabditis briggsae TaxID=6238 RepID=A0AAE9IW72_CAEBR|nr:Protein CBG20931 [Caenorhabditis briggsae]ULU07721.1 hypothetical protein L3Y34_019019 [Caenorhabditis briggsae]CAP37862.1 Protein CBG20931 [Caenorhabditis briggsae]
MPQKLVKSEWEQDKVYLIQFPRTGCLPSPSPYSLKLETWLRMAGIDYENVSNEFKHMSKRGQQPFIELNGEQISDTSIIIDILADKVKGKELTELSTLDKAKEHAFYTLIEHHLTLLGFYSRSQSFKWGKRSICLIDATLFGHLAEILYTPQFTKEIKEYIETNAQNLIAHSNRIKVLYWPDWEEIGQSLKMDTKWR